MAATFVAAAFGLRLLLVPLTGQGAPFVLFFGAVLASGLLGGRGPGLFAAFASAPLGAYFFVAHSGYSSTQATAQASIFVIESVIIAYVAAAFLSAKRHAEETARRLHEADRTRDMFIGILAHDLRNPLNGMLIAAQLVLRRAQDESVGEPARAIVRSGERMGRLIRQILDFARIRHGTGLQLDPAGGDLGRLVEQVAGELVPDHERFVVDVRGDTTGTWDLDRISQVVSNLLANALEHGTPGTPVVVDVDGTGSDAVTITVRNAGTPIPAELRDRIFEPFRGRRRREGLGLGLFICREFVTAHGGTIELEARDDEGTGFRIALPRHIAPPRVAPPAGEPARAPSPLAAPAVSARGARILVVDDEAGARGALAMLLQEEGFDVETATDGLDAVAKLESFAADVLVSDLVMPRLDGAGLLRQARDGRPDLPVILMTGMDDDEKLVELRSLPGVVSLPKPVDLDALLSAIARAIDGHAPM
jgi:signal transduction histidine kinase/CheY-like chemotaxis protein